MTSLKRRVYRWAVLSVLAAVPSVGVAETNYGISTAGFPDWVEPAIRRTYARYLAWKGKDQTVVIPIMTDEHTPSTEVTPTPEPRIYRNHTYYQFRAAEIFDADLFGNLGDLQFDQTPDWKPASAEHAQRRLEVERELYRGLKVPFFFCKGNHDGGNGGFEVTAALFGEKLNGLALEAGHRPTLGPGKDWGSYDVAVKKCRVLFLDSCETGYWGYSDAQVDFVERQLATLPADWCAVVFSHKCLNEHFGYWQTGETCERIGNEAKIRGMLETFVARGGRLAGCVCGDSHFNATGRDHGVDYFVCQGFGGLGGDQTGVVKANPDPVRLTFNYTCFKWPYETLLDVVAIKPTTGELAVFRIGGCDTDRFAPKKPKFRVAGVLGQSRAVEWTGCDWCVADANGNTHFPGGWMAEKGERDVRRLPKTVRGTVYGVGEDLYSWQPDKGMVFRVKATDAGLVEDSAFVRSINGQWRLAFRRDGGLYALDKPGKAVRGWTKEGVEEGVVLDLSAFSEVGRVADLAEHPTSGDIVLITSWPGKVHRFHAGQEIADDLWPRDANGTLAVANGKLWALGGGADEITDRIVSASQRIQVGNGVAQTTRAIVWTGAGWWLATSEGALYCPAAQPGRIAARVGGLADVGALAILNGTVYAFCGHVVHALRIDDFRDEPFSSWDGGPWCVGGAWSERNVVAALVKDGVIWLNEAKEKKAWRFDPSETEWVRRMHRYKVVPMSNGASDLAVTKPDEAWFRGSRISAADLPAKVTAIATEGDYVVGYSPKHRAILRFAPVE